MELGSLQHIELMATQLQSALRCGEEGHAGALLFSFTTYFEKYSVQYNLINDEFLNNLLAVMTDAYTRKDVLFVADILQYELLPYLKNNAV